MYLDTNNGWFVRWRERGRVERQAAREREHRGQEQIDQLRAEYPVDRSRYANARTSSSRGLAGNVAGEGSFWSGFGGDGGFWSGFGGDCGGGDGGGC
jgi:hypothetical protein